MSIFLDETGTDRRDSLRQYAYSWRGSLQELTGYWFEDNTCQVLAFMSTNGVLDAQVVTGDVDGDVYYDFAQSRLLPH